MNTTAFLPSVVNYFSGNNAALPPLQDITFILPNKRSALFLKKHIRDNCRAVTLMPRIMTLRTFAGTFASFPEASQQELLFVLYDAYRAVMQRKGRAEAMKQFDSFIFWGDMMLNDFNDVDNALADASEIFKNLMDVKEIQANYLDDEQKEAIRRVWGESRLTASIEEFWLHVKPENGETVSDRFIYLWEILGEIYTEFHQSLKARRCATTGSQMLEAIEKVKGAAANDFTGRTHYAFVGFNDFTAAETVFVDRLKRQGSTFFFWDDAPLRFFVSNASGIELPKPLKRLAGLIRNFPMPADFDTEASLPLPDVSVTAVPSNVSQAKYIDIVLRNWLANEFYNPGNPINTAIILPDQGLLLPVLASIPEEVNAVNISLGLPYRTTTFASLLHSVISMQLRSRKIRGSYHFYYEDVEAVLTHPHIQAVAAAEANALTALINEGKLFNVSAEQLVTTGPALKALFTPVRTSGNVHEVAAYLKALLDWLGAELTALSENDSLAQSRTDDEKFEILAIEFFRQRIDELTELIDRFGVQMNENTFFHLFEKVFFATGLTLAGTPLAGLQILGVLETRNLDFDNVIVLSMNEGVLPRRRYSKTMIPANLRTGYGLPDIDASEWAYAYSFYRIIARAKRVALFYDSRPEGVGNGEISRYITQLDYLIPGLKINKNVLTMGAASGLTRGITVSKTPQIMEYLDRFRYGKGNLRFSATAIKSYLQCKLQFYLKYVRKMRADNELTDNISAAEYGTAVHTVIQTLYEKHPGGIINADTIKSWLDGTSVSISDLVLKHLDSTIYPSYAGLPLNEHPVECRVAADTIEVLVRSNLIAELSAYCTGDSFQYIGNEVIVSTEKAGRPWTVAPGIDINYFMSIDRLDRRSDGMMRIIDFKTGSDDIILGNIGDLYSGNHEKMAIFQILLYCEAYLALKDGNAKIEPRIHLIRSLAASIPIEKIRINKAELEDYETVRKQFNDVLVKIMSEIFDPAVPFAQNEDDKNCKYCPFLSLCGRAPKTF